MLVPVRDRARQVHARRLGCSPLALRRSADQCERAESIGSRRAGLRGVDRLGEDRGCLLRVARVEPVLRSGDAPPAEHVGRLGWSEGDCAVGELGRLLGGAAAAGVRRRRVERRRDLLVRAGCGDREMAGPLLRVDVQGREAAVQLAPPVQRHVLVAEGCEQGMRESDPVAVELEHAPPAGQLDVVHRSRSKGARSVTEGAPRAATATSVSRTCSGSELSRSATRARRLSGRSTCRPSARIVPSASARPISSAKNGFPPAASCTRTSTGRGRLSESRPHRSRWIARSRAA